MPTFFHVFKSSTDIRFMATAEGDWTKFCGCGWDWMNYNFVAVDDSPAKPLGFLDSAATATLANCVD